MHLRAMGPLPRRAPVNAARGPPPLALTLLLWWSAGALLVQCARAQSCYGPACSTFAKCDSSSVQQQWCVTDDGQIQDHWGRCLSRHGARGALTCAWGWEGGGLRFESETATSLAF